MSYVSCTFAGALSLLLDYSNQWDPSEAMVFYQLLSLTKYL